MRVSVDILGLLLVLPGCGDLGPGPGLHLVTPEHEVEPRARDVDPGTDPEHGAPLRHLKWNTMEISPQWDKIICSTLNFAAKFNEFAAKISPLIFNEFAAHF